MFRSSFLFLFVCCFLLWGCNEDDTPFSGDGGAVSFSTDISGVFSSPTRVTGDHWDVNDPVGIYMVNGASGTIAGNCLHANALHTAATGGSSSTALVASGDNRMVFPNSGSVRFAAYYPHNSTLSATNYTYPVDVSDQTKNIDLLYTGYTQAYKQDENPVSLSFKHQLCKLVINVYRDQSSTNTITESAFKSLNVGLSGTYRKGNFNLSGGGLTGLSDQGAIAAVHKTVGTGASGSPSVYEIIFLPDGTRSGRSITFNLGGGNYSIPSTQTFEKGTKYTCDIMISQSSPVLLTSGLTPWTGGGMAGNSTHYIKVSEAMIQAPLSAGSGTFTVITDATASTLSISRSNSTMIVSCSITNTAYSGGVYTHTVTYNYSTASSERESFITLTHGSGPSLAVSVKQSDSGGTSGGGNGGPSGGGGIDLDEANCYILYSQTSGNAIYIPVRRANIFSPGAITSTYTTEVLWWQNADGSTEETVTAEVYTDGPNGVIKVTSKGKNGNALVVAKVGGDIVWSWLVWCSSTNISSVGYDGLAFLDRNLGAMSSGTSNKINSTLHYQWGRKDPWPIGETQGAKLTVTGSNWTDFMLSRYPHRWAGVARGDWYTNKQGRVRWEGKSKSIHDPCPPNWRIPTIDELRRVPKSTVPLDGYCEVDTKTYDDIIVYNRGLSGGLWSGTLYGGGSAYVWGEELRNENEYRSTGMSVRCVAE